MVTNVVVAEEADQRRDHSDHRDNQAAAGGGSRDGGDGGRGSPGATAFLLGSHRRPSFRPSPDNPTPKPTSRQCRLPRRPAGAGGVRTERRVGGEGGDGDYGVSEEYVLFDAPAVRLGVPVRASSVTPSIPRSVVPCPLPICPCRATDDGNFDRRRESHPPPHSPPPPPPPRACHLHARRRLHHPPRTQPENARPTNKRCSHSSVCDLLQVGGAVIFDYRVRHFGCANESARDRPCLYLTCSKPWFVDVRNYATPNT